MSPLVVVKIVWMNFPKGFWLGWKRDMGTHGTTTLCTVFPKMLFPHKDFYWFIWKVQWHTMRNILPSGALPKRPNKLRAGQAEVRSPEFHVKPQYWATVCCPSRAYVGNWSEGRGKTWSQALWHRRQAPWATAVPAVPPDTGGRCPKQWLSLLCRHLAPWSCFCIWPTAISQMFVCSVAREKVCSSKDPHFFEICVPL